MTDSGRNNHEQDDVSLYEKILKQVEETVDSGRKNFDEALKKAAEEMSSASSVTREQTEKVMNYIRKDVQHAVESAGRAKDSLKEAVEPTRVVVGVQSLFSTVLSNAASTLNDWAKKSEQQLEYKTGEITSPGTLSCKNCTEQIHMKKTGRIPPCPKCHSTYFRKSY